MWHTVANMIILVDIFVWDAYVAITCGVVVKVGCILVDMCKTLALHTPIPCWQYKLHLKYGSHICSVISVKHVYSVPCYMVDGGDFLCGKFMCIHPPYRPIKYFAYISNLVGLFLSDTYLATTC